jgi:hypothetical protein
MSSQVFYLQSWKNFAKKHKGEISNSHSEYRVHHIAVKDPLRRIQLSIPFQDSHIVFDSGESSSLKIFYEFDENLVTEFHIYKKDFLDRIQKFFGKKEIILGESQFDKLFFIQSSNEPFIIKAFDPVVQSFLIEFHRNLAGFQLKTINEKSIVQLKIHFDERNLETMEKVLEFFKHIVSKKKIISPILGS